MVVSSHHSKSKSRSRSWSLCTNLVTKRRIWVKSVEWTGTTFVLERHQGSGALATQWMDKSRCCACNWRRCSWSEKLVLCGCWNLVPHLCNGQCWSEWSSTAIHFKPWRRCCLKHCLLVLGGKVGQKVALTLLCDCLNVSSTCLCCPFTWRPLHGRCCVCPRSQVWGRFVCCLCCLHSRVLWDVSMGLWRSCLLFAEIWATIAPCWLVYQAAFDIDKGNDWGCVRVVNSNPGNK